MVQLLKNPFYLYPVSFALVFLIYSLWWSNLFPPLSITIILFFVLTFALSFIVGLIVDKLKLIKYNKINYNEIFGYKTYIFFIY